MIVVRNADQALSLSARTSDATMVPGMIVKFVQAAASGDQPKVSKATAADIADVTVKKGIIDYIQPDSQFVDFTIDTNAQTLTPIAETIPAGAQVNVWMGDLVIAYHSASLPAGLTALREAGKVAFDGDTNLPADYASGATDGRQVASGIVYRIDGPEFTLLISV